MDSLILKTLPDPILLISEDRQVIEANAAAEDLFGSVSPGQDLSMTTRSPDVLEAVEAVLESRTNQSLTVSFTHPIQRTFELTTALVEAGDKMNQARVMLVFHDITPIIATEKFRTNFIANVSHELRSPLVSLIGFIETLQTTAKNDEEARQHFLKIMDMEAGRMKSLIDDLLSLSKIEANEHVRPNETVRIPDVINIVMESLGNKASERSITLKCDCHRGLPEVLGSAEELIQVFNNLVDNAIKYGARDSTVTIRAEQQERMANLGVPGLKISIHNQGEAISPEHLPRLTERFYRIDKGRSRAIGGTGLGLAIVKHMVNRHRGRLTIESTPSEGTTFSVFLPTLP